MKDKRKQSRILGFLYGLLWILGWEEILVSFVLAPGALKFVYGTIGVGMAAAAWVLDVRRKG